MSSIAQELAELQTAVSESQTVNLATAAALTWLAYDIFLTMEEEVQLIWRHSLSLPSVLYVITRYFALVFVIVQLAVLSTYRVPAQFCNTFYRWFSGYGLAYLVLAMSTLLAMRLRAMFKPYTIVVRLLYFLLFSEYVVEIVIVTLTVREVEELVLPPSVPIPGCLALRVPRFFAGAWGINLSVSSIYLGMTLFQAYITLRDGGLGKTVRTLSRDGMIVFIVNFVIALFAYTWTDVMSGEFLPLAVPWLAATIGVAASRLVLSLRSLSLQDGDGHNFADVVDISSGIRFAKVVGLQHPRSPHWLDTTVDDGADGIAERADGVHHHVDVDDADMSDGDAQSVLMPPLPIGLEHGRSTPVCHTPQPGSRPATPDMETHRLLRGHDDMV